MEVIYRGIHPLEKTYKGTCPDCQTRVQFLRKEATVIAGKCTVGCPVCNNTIVEDKKTAPTWRDEY